ncbi:MAG: hypothetical protein WBC20_04615 [Candidatus Aminicenantaceae bacterium]
MKKKLISVFVILSLFLVIGIVLYLEARPNTCREWNIILCEEYRDGIYYYFFEFWAYYNGDWVEVYDTYCWNNWHGMGPEMEWWGECWDIDDIW